MVELPTDVAVYSELVEQDCRGRAPPEAQRALRAQDQEGLRMWKSTLQVICNNVTTQLSETKELREQLFRANPTEWERGTAQYTRWRTNAQYFRTHVERRLIEVELLLTRALRLADPFELLTAAATSMSANADWTRRYEALLAHRAGRAGQTN